MGSLQDKLAAAQAQKAKASAPQQQRTPAKQPIVEQAFIDTDINSLDDMVFGAPTDSDDLLESYPNGSQRPKYDPNREMEEIKNGGAVYDNPNSKLPKAILESIMLNPLNIEPIEDASEQVIDENIQNRTMDIIDKLEKRERKAKISTSQPQQEYITENIQPASNIDMNQLAQLIESIVDKKFKQYSSTLLTESRKHQTPQMGLMTLGKNFRFMDSNGAVYECEMKYIGKGKVKSK